VIRTNRLATFKEGESTVGSFYLYETVILFRVVKCEPRSSVKRCVYGFKLTYVPNDFTSVSKDSYVPPSVKGL